MRSRRDDLKMWLLVALAIILLVIFDIVSQHISYLDYRKTGIICEDSTVTGFCFKYKKCVNMQSDGACLKWKEVKE